MLTLQSLPWPILLNLPHLSQVIPAVYEYYYRLSFFGYMYMYVYI